MNFFEKHLSINSSFAANENRKFSHEKEQELLSGKQTFISVIEFLEIIYLLSISNIYFYCPTATTNWEGQKPKT